MRLLAVLLCLIAYNSLPAQQLNLTSLQHEVRWLDEVRFPPYVKDPTISKEILNFTSSALAKKFNVTPGKIPGQIDYKFIAMFGKPRFSPPAGSDNPNDHQASILSFITRATSGTEVYWEMKAEVKQNGKTIYSRETKHELANYDAGWEWFTDRSFIANFTMLIDELLELRPALAYKQILGKGVDYAEQLRMQSEPMVVTKNSNLLGFGMPSFGPYTTISAGRLDTPVIRTKKVLGTESSVGVSSGVLSFDQFKNIDQTKRKLCYLQLLSGSDTLDAVYSVINRTLGQRRTFLSDLLSKDDENNTPSSVSYRNLAGMIRIDTMEWEFQISAYDNSGSIGGGFLQNEQNNFQLSFNQPRGLQREILTTNQNGEHVASLMLRSSDPELRIWNTLDPSTARALAALYAVIMSARNVQ